ncbi:MAG: hypothetical protein IKF18_00440 [Erysipelotrichaceae bacterium]|nr:hypothetical protein [Erysipelotrichaceae bacterium]
MLMLLLASGCSVQNNSAPAEPEKPAAERTDDIYIFYTSDVHCGVEENLTLASVKSLVDETKAEHEYVALVDLGDFLQGDTLGSLSNGRLIIDALMTYLKEQGGFSDSYRETDNRITDK